MSGQDEYLRNFTLLLTEKGVVPLTDPLQIAVYNQLCTGSKRPSDLTSSLDLPSSSLHFAIDKMLDTGVIVRLKPDPSKKTVYYSNLAMKIASSAEPDPEAAKRCEETFRNPSEHCSGLAAVANMLDCYAEEIGLSLDQLRSRYATELADSMKYEIGHGDIQDSILKIKERFAQLTGFKFSVFSLSPLTLVFEGSEIISREIDMFSAFVGRAVENATDKPLAITSLEDYSSEGSTRYKVVYERTEKVPEPYINMSLSHGEATDRFLMVELDGSVGIITSPVQIDIIDAVYERPLCVTDIVGQVDAPRSTITSNMLRMVEDGVISVFYSESGIAYYGLSCSILMKKSRRVNRDSSAVSTILKETRTKEGSFMEGYLRFTLETLKGLGLDTDYMMVVLGAKYMRLAGSEGPKNFDVFFGKMSSVAQSIGISMNVVSVYPLTIGIASSCPDSEIYPAMTFVKGMAHQGLEMASNGIFVRVSDDSPADRKVSFKEIYPTLSLTPLKGIEVKGLADEVPDKKKRVSSVKVALRNRNAKEGGKPARTVRYITGIAMAIMLAGVLVFGLAGSSDELEAGNYSMTLDDGCDGVTFYDESGSILQMPLSVAGGTLRFSVDYLGSTKDIGMTDQGVVYPIDSVLRADDNGVYTIAVKENIVFRAIEKAELPEDAGLTYSVYDFGSNVSDAKAYSFGDYIPVDEYIEKAGGLWTTSTTVFEVESAPGKYITAQDGDDCVFLFEKVVCERDEVGSVMSSSLPSKYTEVELNGSYMADETFVKDVVLKVVPDSLVSLQFLTSITNVTIAMNGSPLAQDVNHVVTFTVGDEDIVITYEGTDWY